MDATKMLALATAMAMAGSGLAQAQDSPPPLPRVVSPRDPAPPPLDAPTTQDPPARPAGSSRCEAFLRLEFGLRTIVCRLPAPQTPNATCFCRYPPPPPGLLPSPPAEGHVIS